MPISSKDLKIIEDAAGYGAVASVDVIDGGMSIKIGKVYDGLGWFGGTLRLTFDEVDRLDSDKSELHKFAEQARKMFDSHLAGKYLK